MKNTDLALPLDLCPICHADKKDVRTGAVRGVRVFYDCGTQVLLNPPVHLLIPSRGCLRSGVITEQTAVGRAGGR